MVAITNARILFNSVPTGLPEPGRTTVTDRAETIDLDLVTLDGGILVKTVALSVDPYMRLLMRSPDEQSPPGVPAKWELGKSITGLGVVKVVRSDTRRHNIGQHLFGFVAFQDYSVITDPSQLQVLPEATGLPWSTFLGVAGITGLTAYSSWKEYSRAKSGEIAFVSSGAGAVGSIVIQLAKQDGLKVIASASSDKKVEFMKRLGADVAFNYKSTSTHEILSKEGPVDIYYDNVGGEIADAALANANENGRIIFCGSITGYNGEHSPIKNYHQIWSKHLCVQGFTVEALMPKYAAEFYATVPIQAAKGELKWQEHVYHGLEDAHQALLDVQTGKNEGKAVVVM